MAWAERRAAQLKEERTAQQKEREWWLHARKVTEERAPDLWKSIGQIVATEISAFNHRGDTHVQLEHQGIPSGFEIYKRPYPTRRLRAVLEQQRIKYTVVETLASGYSDVVEDGVIGFSLDDENSVWIELPNREQEADVTKAAEFLLDLALGLME